jgi:hypothetical protein
MERIRIQNAALTAYDAERRRYRRRYAALVREADRTSTDAEYAIVMAKLAAANARLAAAKLTADNAAEYKVVA